MPIAATKPASNSLRTMNGFWWTDLQTADAAAAAEFYGRVLGWSYEEVPLGPTPAEVYRTAHIGGAKLAGMGEFQSDMPEAARQPRWNNYVYVPDVDAVVASAARLGATVAMEAIEVLDQGRMAVIVDPAGAALNLWQPRAHTGADEVNQPSTYSWVELVTSDVDGSKRFYGELLGWGWELQDVAGVDYWMATLDGRRFAGLMHKPVEMGDAPSMWLTYFGVADLDATLAEMRAAGGRVVTKPMQMGPGLGAGIVDPQGAYVLVIQMDEWPEV